MKNFTDRVAVVTGGASGIGLATATRLAAEGMRIVLADVEEAALADAEAALRDSGAEVLGVRTDVSKADEVEALADKTLERFGAVHVLFNNAGVAITGAAWENTISDWEWILGVNLWGVIHGLRSFVPRMIEQGTEGHVINTASMAGLTSNPFMGAYNVTKHSVVTLSETLHHDLALAGSQIRASVLCPGFIKTRIMDSARNRLGDNRHDPDAAQPSEGAATVETALRDGCAAGIEPATVAGQVFEAIRDERFYILPAQDEVMAVLSMRFDEIRDLRNPQTPGLLVDVP